MASDYEKIKEENKIEYGIGENHLSHYERQYADRTHFILELLQNAEDAGATRINFNLYEDRLEIKHNGREFNESDVRGVCGIHEGSKGGDPKKIGKFGIGFKSVYAYTSTPEIYSGEESFCIKKYTRPKGVSIKKIDAPWTTLFVLPFNKGNLKTSVAEISERFLSLSAQTILFLSTIEDFKYKLPDGTIGVHLREEKEQHEKDCLYTGHDNDTVTIRKIAVTVQKIEQGKKEEKKEIWYIFGKSVAVSKKSPPVEIGFMLNNGDEGKNQDIKKIKQSPLMVYFPTAIKTRFGFLVNGPYEPTPARDNIIKKGEEGNWNIGLIRETSLLIVEVLHILKEINLLTITALEVLPIRKEESDFDEKDILFNATREALLNYELLPVEEGVYVSAKNAKLAGSAGLRNLLTHEQLTELFDLSEDIERQNIKWLAEGITQDRTRDLYSYLVEILAIKQITPNEFAEKITESFLKKQTDQWLIAFYGYLLDWRPRRKGVVLVDGPLKDKPILRLQDGTHVTPFGYNGKKPNAYLPSQEESDFPIIKREISNNEVAGEFLKELGLTKPDIFDEIIEKILPKYDDRKHAPTTKKDKEGHARDIEKILRAMESDSKDGKDKLSNMAKDRKFLLAINKEGEIAYQSPGDIYLSNEDLQNYFSQTVDVWFLHESPDPSYPNKIWVELGVADKPRRIKTEKERLDVRDHRDRSREWKNYDLHGLDEFLKSLTNATGQKRKEFSLILWKFLKSHLESNPEFFSGQYLRFTYRAHNASRKPFDSDMLVRLRDSAWIPTREGHLEKPKVITIKQLHGEFCNAGELIDKLKIGYGWDDGAEKFGFSDEQSLNHGRMFANLPLETRQEFLEFWRSEQIRKDGLPQEKLANPERRIERAREAAKSAPESEKEKRMRTVDPNQDAVRGELAKPYLIDRYTKEGTMICQICMKSLPFKFDDGTDYFEAVKFIKMKKHHPPNYLALCPNHAAMFRYANESADSMREKFIDFVGNGIKGGALDIKLARKIRPIYFDATHIADLCGIILPNNDEIKDKNGE